MASVISASTTSATALNLSGDTSGILQIATGATPTTAITVDASQNVGIGVTPNTSKVYILTAGTAVNALEIYSPSTTNGAKISLSDGNYGSYIQTSPSAGSTSLVFGNTGTERMRIDASGRITSPYQPSFLATATAGGFPTQALGTYFTFNSLPTTFSTSNRNAGFNTSNYYYTAPVSGIYVFYCQLYLVNGNNTTAWFKNGSQVSYTDAAIAANSTTTGGFVFNSSIILNLAAGDYVGLQPRSGTSATQWYPGHSCFYGYLLG